jgi:hypothetical protein
MLSGPFASILAARLNERIAGSEQTALASDQGES